MERKNQILWLLASTIIQMLIFLFIRYPLLSLHNMRQWAFILFVLGLVVIIVATIFKSKTILIATPIGYGTGFVIGVLFNTDSYDPGGGLLNNAWLIWTAIYLLLIAIVIIWEWIHRKQ